MPSRQWRSYQGKTQDVKYQVKVSFSFHVISHFMLEVILEEKKEVEWTRKAETRKVNSGSRWRTQSYSLTTPGFKDRMSDSCALTAERERKFLLLPRTLACVPTLQTMHSHFLGNIYTYSTSLSSLTLQLHQTSWWRLFFFFFFPMDVVLYLRIAAVDL